VATEVSFLSTFARVAIEEVYSSEAVIYVLKATKVVKAFSRLIAPVAERISRGFFFCLKIPRKTILLENKVEEHLTCNKFRPRKKRPYLQSTKVAIRKRL
jgi:hypothetical protein